MTALPSTSIFFDFVLIALLAFFAWRGAKRGLILSLCGLLAFFVAFFGASILSEAFYQPVSGVIRPVIENAVTKALEDAGSSLGLAGGGGAESASVSTVLSALREADVFRGMVSLLEDAEASHALVQGARTGVRAVSDYLARAVAKSVLFALAFLGIQLIWFLSSHALDLAFHLPILSQVNLAGGLVLGLVKGALLAVVLVWLGQLAGWVPAEPDSPLLSLFTVDRLWELLGNLTA